MLSSSKNLDLWKEMLKSTRLKRRKVGIGLKKVTPRILESLKKASKYVDIVVIGKKVPGFESIESETFEPLLQLAKERKIDALVRGNFDAVAAYKAAKKVLNHQGGIIEANFFKLQGVNLIDKNAKGIFCVLPVSFTNERSLKDKIRSIDLHLEFFKKINLVPKIGILAPGKPEDIAENISEVTAGLKEAEKLVQKYSEQGIWVKHFNHQIEKAVLEANIIVAQNSWTGNMAVHCLLYLGKCEYIGGVALNIEGIIYVDDSEAMEDFTNCLIFAGFLANIQKI